MIALVLMVLVLMGGTGYYFSKSDAFDAGAKENQKYEKVTMQKEKRTAEVSVKEKIKKNSEQQLTAIEEKEKSRDAQQIAKQRKIAMNASYEDTSEESTLHIKSPVVDRSRRPRLVIIIDDVATPKQLSEIQAVPLKLTPSLFPPSNHAISTVKMAKNLKHYMVHFPMEAGDHPRGAMPNTVTIRDSKAKIRARVKELRKWFPASLYINNHTGSVFTADYKAMQIMYGLLKEEGFLFLDSRTSPKSKGKRVANEYGDFYLHRDVFIDNVQKFGAIRKQLKFAVKKAKQRGYAIAIGHPHRITLRSLKNSLDILVDVDVVYLDELF
ncbi:MAG: divergent polysaccharide deacetylase family protein [Campylobacterota bacterium]|nr:divergent polysaccharide deacetylase family protein [Campylobacterota bacterium]